MAAALTALNLDPLYAAGQLFLLASARPLGLTVTFTVFAWAHVNSGLLRIALAAALALPVMAPIAAAPVTVLDALPAPYVVLLGKELALGSAIGFLAALPFEAAVIAGGAVDAYRGGGPGQPGPAGELTPFGQLFVVIALFLFAVTGGFWWIADALYASYGLFPLTALGPGLPPDGVARLVSALGGMLSLAVVLAGPLILLMFLSDLGFLVAAKLARQVNTSLVAFSAKNLLALVVLPLYAMVVIRVLGDEMARFATFDRLIARLFGG